MVERPTLKRFGGQFGATPKKIWVSAIDENAPSGSDPSNPRSTCRAKSGSPVTRKLLGARRLQDGQQYPRDRDRVRERSGLLRSAGHRQLARLQKPIANPPKRHCIPKASSGCSWMAPLLPVRPTPKLRRPRPALAARTGSVSADRATVFATGTFTARLVAECGKGKKPVWQVVQWKATLPAGTSIDFTGASAATSAGLATATTVPAGNATTSTSGTAWSVNSVNLDTNLRGINVGSLNYLRVVTTLNPSSDKLRTPTLSNWRVVYDCFDAE